MEGATTGGSSKRPHEVPSKADNGSHASKKVCHEEDRAEDQLENKQEEDTLEKEGESLTLEAATVHLGEDTVRRDNGDEKGTEESYVEQGGPSDFIADDNHSRDGEARIDDDKKHAEEGEGHQDVTSVSEKKEKATDSEAKVGPKVFTSSVDIFNYFYNLLHGWPLHFNLNKYEHMMLEDLIVKGHNEPEKKIGAGIQAFQVRFNPEFYSRCYYIIRKDGSVDDLSYRKCVDKIMALPEDLKSGSVDARLGHRGGRRDRGNGGFQGRGNRGRGRRCGHGRF